MSSEGEGQIRRRLLVAGRTGATGPWRGCLPPTVRARIELAVTVAAPAVSGAVVHPGRWRVDVGNVIADIYFCKSASDDRLGLLVAQDPTTVGILRLNEHVRAVLRPDGDPGADCDAGEPAAEKIISRKPSC
ncbi:hypothetical protein [Micromonospora phaseoli]|uniref:hypothetical protein n=1 Tax=Micromonospora phaseoli TaxID=1144548 RepID=UPI001113EDC3|nr:hypothetical protein [Micromonospora phaseoli]